MEGTTLTHQHCSASPVISVTVDRDATYNTLLDAFISLSAAIGYSNEAIQRCVVELAEQYSDA